MKSKFSKEAILTVVDNIRNDAQMSPSRQFDILQDNNAYTPDVLHIFDTVFGAVRSNDASDENILSALALLGYEII